MSAEVFHFFGLFFFGGMRTLSGSINPSHWFCLSSSFSHLTDHISLQFPFGVLSLDFIYFRARTKCFTDVKDLRLEEEHSPDCRWCVYCLYTRDSTSLLIISFHLNDKIQNLSPTLKKFAESWAEIFSFGFGPRFLRKKCLSFFSFSHFTIRGETFWKF